MPGIFMSIESHIEHWEMLAEQKRKADAEADALFQESMRKAVRQETIRQMACQLLVQENPAPDCVKYKVRAAVARAAIIFDAVQSVEVPDE